MDRTYGSKYSLANGLPLSGIAKLIRADVKAAIADGTLPKSLKVSVQTRTYSGGGAIDIRIVSGLTACQAYSPEGMRAIAEDRHCPPYLSTGSSLKATIETLKGLHGAYNHDGSDVMTDYFDVRYYGCVSVDWELDRDLRAEAVSIHNVRAAKPRRRFQFAQQAAA